jgi:hypothetical protein
MHGESRKKKEGRNGGTRQEGWIGWWKEGRKGEREE